MNGNVPRTAGHKRPTDNSVSESPDAAHAVARDEQGHHESDQKATGNRPNADATNNLSRSTPSAGRLKLTSRPFIAVITKRRGLAARVLPPELMISGRTKTKPRVRGQFRSYAQARMRSQRGKEQDSSYRCPALYDSITNPMAKEIAFQKAPPRDPLGVFGQTPPRTTFDTCPCVKNA